MLPEANCVVFSTCRDCDDVLRPPSSSNDRLKSTIIPRLLHSCAVSRSPAFLFFDPPGRTLLRRLVNKACASKVVNALQPNI
ncbi:hypothetical protein [Mycobacterium uberis]|uniref:hypothetical protein n=1 Tax=Mycobacterium uberis TaxID=2162698 RepID=UPI001058A154|nr:hypothetical protein [Mycobacterium uberis]